MRVLCLVLAFFTLEPQALTAQKEEFFSEAEVLQALGWGMPDSAARKLVRFMSEDPAIAARDPEIRDLGPASIIYSENMLLLLSLVSVETNAKVERRLVERRLGSPLTPAERADWETKRADLRAKLVKAGKLSKE